tara:strand:- start:80 stop:1051 length:972 start_codon:yes stop_codon:yes gene_type:complete
MKRIITLFVFGVFFVSLTHTTFAQFSSAPGVGGVSLELSPRYPEPGEQVRITINDYTLNTNGATNAWFIDGIELTNAANERSILITAGELGSTTEVVEVTTLASGVELQSKVVIEPVRVDMLVEADTITPAFYKGRSVPAEGSLVRVTALPFESTTKSPSSYAYTWKVRNKVISGGSRFGKNSISFTSDFGKNIPVSVEVYDDRGNIVTSESTVVPLADPELYFYEVNPLRGVAEHIIGSNYTFIGDEIKVRAEPYFIDRALLAQNPYIEWKLNNRTIQNPSTDPQEITLRKEGDRGSFQIEFHIRNLQQLLQGVKDSITISF